VTRSGVETCPIPRLGCTGGRGSFGGRHLRLRLDRAKPLLFRSRQSSALRRFPSQLPGRVQSVVLWRGSANPHQPQSGNGDLASAGGGGTVDQGKDPLGHACDSVAPDPGDPRAERLLGQRPGKGAMELEPRQCQRHRVFGQQGSLVAGSWTMSASVLCSRRRRTSRSRPFSGSLPARRSIDPAPRRWSRRAGRDRNPWGLTFDDKENGAR